MSELIGRKLGKYTLAEKLGEGGMAMVFRSFHPQFNRPVAIKILPPTVGQDPGFQARFEREGRLIAGLNHPNIIRVYDIDEQDGLFYMVMDLLPGGTLEGRLRGGGLDRKWSANVVVKMAEALDYAHARDVIHRDIKPSNILMDADGNPVLADFGIARLMQGDADANLTSTGMVMGTPAYMAPEQLTGQQPDARADIYSLGVVLYQLLAGRAPFTGDTMAVVSAHLTKQPPTLREYVPDLPAALDAVVLQALAKQPEHRFKSAGVFAQALRNAALDLEPAMVRVVSAAPKSAASSFGGAGVPQAMTGATQPMIAAQQPPLSTGQQVTRYLPIILGVLGLLLLISLLAQYWAIVVLLVFLLVVGGFLFIYFRARSAGRKAAAETTRAITRANLHATPANAPAAATAPLPTSTPATPAPAAALASPATAALEHDQRMLPTEVVSQSAPDNLAPTEAVSQSASGNFVTAELVGLSKADDVPEMPVTAALEHNDLAPTEMVAQAASGDFAPTEMVAQAASGDFAPTEMVAQAAPDDLAPTEMVAQAAPDDLAPTEMVAQAAPDDLAPTEAVPMADSSPTAVPPEQERHEKP
jgi:eukaryotic-like serine/threonine-protein kinase